MKGCKNMSDAKYQEILKKMSLEEKAMLLSGETFWLTRNVEKHGIPSVWMSDGPHGLRKEKVSSGATNVMQTAETATCFPTSATTAGSWDVELLEEIGNAIAEEAKALKVTTVLGPGINIKRSPLCGRNFEYFSEDPYLTGKLAAAFVHGVQKNKVRVSLKHYCANNQEHLRMAINSVVDERALREIYLSAFEHVVKTEQPGTVMSSYNRLNGTFLTDNKRMLTDILRDEWGFKGIVVSDWGAINDRIEGIKAGQDLEMPGNKGMNDKDIANAVRDGRITEEELDRVALRMIKFAFECKADETEGGEIDFDKHHKLARKAAAQSAILLKNEGNILPLKKEQNIAVVGKLASSLRYQGSGSSHINCPKTVSFVEALKAQNQAFAYADGYTMKGTGYDKALMDEAVNTAKGKDAVVVFIGLTDEYESEGFDRDHIEIPEAHYTLVNEIKKVNDNVIVVLSGGAVINISKWEKDAKAILNLYLTGQAGGEATYDLIYGLVNPSGKLAETYPVKLEDNIVSKYFPMGPRNVEYRESVYVGYRYFDSAKKEVMYPFGHGLSYTTFEYSDLKLSSDSINENDGLTVTFKIKNTGSVAGAEVAEVYVKDVDSTIYRPEKELKGFKKVYLEPGEEKEVEITLDSRSFSYYNVCISDWHVESGEFKILVGASSRDIRLEGSVNVESNNPNAEIPNYKESAPAYYDISKVNEIGVGEFEALYGEKMEGNAPFTKGTLTINNSIDQLSCSGFGKVLRFAMKIGAAIVAMGTENPAMIKKSVMDMPLRSFSGFSGGVLSPRSVDGLLDMCNGTKGGVKKLINGFKKEK